MTVSPRRYTENNDPPAEKDPPTPFWYGPINWAIRNKDEIDAVGNVFRAVNAVTTTVANIWDLGTTFLERAKKDKNVS
ncbi:MAG: hypothetical protein F6K40_37890 [Okeania sp. SIO3I5]|uniref:hypothetical protein n=1 Tax=Okeania sp. SIO3I5 TaxID=2607805 RepID=UPI0013BA7AC0|nr:hypothetical protein [Okeania sp. SIO3I5]NEQ41658.1 hypothetical protein [Okeania sp. SIO3I5]